MTEPRGRANPLFLREAELGQGMEMLFYAYRDFAAAADGLLARHGLGRAHHRVLYFVGRQPRLTVGELLDTLDVTKQSLSRVLRRLTDDGLVHQHRGARDARHRELELTARGAELERQLTEAQRRRLAEAYRAAGAEAVEGFRSVLAGMLPEATRARITGDGG